MPRRSIWSARQRAALFDLPHGRSRPAAPLHAVRRRHRADPGAVRGHNRLGLALQIGRQGEIRDRSSEGQQYRMAGLNLLVAILIHWNLAISAKRSDSGNTPG